MNFMNLENKISMLPEFSEIGGSEPDISFPLFRETAKEKYIVHMIYTRSPYVPSGFVLTPFSTGEPKVYNIADALALLEMKEEDFVQYDEKDAPPPKDLEEFPEYTEQMFYKIIENPDFDREVYAGYVHTIMDYCEAEERKYYRVFI